MAGAHYLDKGHQLAVVAVWQPGSQALTSCGSETQNRAKAKTARSQQK